MVSISKMKLVNVLDTFHALHNVFGIELKYPEWVLPQIECIKILVGLNSAPSLLRSNNEHFVETSPITSQLEKELAHF